jgi:uncharacterized protein YbgA (DUF1722 family)
VEYKIRIGMSRCLSDRSLKEFLDFHTHHKYLILAHSSKYYSELGRIAASTANNRDDLYAAYITLLMNALRLAATVKKNTNVLEHIMGYFKKQLTHDEKKELREVIG